MRRSQSICLVAVRRRGSGIYPSVTPRDTAGEGVRIDPVLGEPRLGTGPPARIRPAGTGKAGNRIERTGLAAF